MLALAEVLPERYWIEINERLVPFGKFICTGAAAPVLDLPAALDVPAGRRDGASMIVPRIQRILDRAAPYTPGHPAADTSPTRERGSFADVPQGLTVTLAPPVGLVLGHGRPWVDPFPRAAF